MLADYSVAKKCQQ
jgi:hypothetical protein